MNRQPLHVVYGGAHRFRRDTAPKLGRIALQAFAEHRDLLPVTDEIAALVEAKLRREPVEDFRIDFEDGYGAHSDEEEDAHACVAARELAAAIADNTAPPRIGIRVKPFSPRAVRTLKVFFEKLGPPPAGFAVTLPKVRTANEAELLRRTLDLLDVKADIEIMVETPQCLRSLHEIMDACGDGQRAAHFGPYDFTASCGLIAPAQGLRHPLCTHARNEMLIALAETDVWLSDGPTAALPIGDRAAVAAAWDTQMADIRHALDCGFHQGWDLHPAQLPARYAAVFTYFRERLPQVAARWRNYKEQATRLGGAFDDAATVRGLQHFLTRALDSGAITKDEAGP